MPGGQGPEDKEQQQEPVSLHVLLGEDDQGEDKGNGDNEVKASAFNALRAKDAGYGRAIRKDLNDRYKALVGRADEGQQGVIRDLYTNWVRELNANPKEFIKMAKEIGKKPRQMGGVSEIEILELVLLRMLTWDMRYKDVPSLLKKQENILGLLQSGEGDGLIDILTQLSTRGRGSGGERKDRTVDGITSDISAIKKQSNVTRRMLDLFQQKRAELIGLRKGLLDEKLFYEGMQRLDGVKAIAFCAGREEKKDVDKATKPAESKGGWLPACIQDNGPAIWELGKSVAFVAGIAAVFFGAWNIFGSIQEIDGGQDDMTGEYKDPEPMAGHYKFAYKLIYALAPVPGLILFRARREWFASGSKQHAEEEKLLADLYNGEDIADAFSTSTKNRISEVAQENGIRRAHLRKADEASARLLALTSNSARSVVPFSVTLLSNAAMLGFGIALSIDQRYFYQGGFTIGTLTAFLYGWKKFSDEPVRDVEPKVTLNTFVAFLKEAGLVTEKQLESQLVSQRGTKDGEENKNTWLERIREQFAAPAVALAQ